MKLTCAILLSLFYSLNTVAQSLTFNWAPMLEQTKKSLIVSMQTSDDLSSSFVESQGAPVYWQGIKTSDGQYAVGTQSSQNSKITITPLDLKLELPAVYSPYNETPLNKVVTFSSGSKKIVLYSDRKESSSNADWYLRSVNGDGKLSDPTPFYHYTSRMEHKNGGATALRNQSAIEDELHTASSKNFEYHVAVFTHPGADNEPDKIHVVLFDKNLVESHHGDFRLPVADRSFKLEQVFVTNEGKIFLFGGFMLRKNESNKEQADLSAAYFRLQFPDQLEAIDVEPMKDGVMTDKLYTLSDDGYFFISGLLKKNEDKKNAYFFQIKINANSLEDTHQSVVPVPEDMLEKLGIKSGYWFFTKILLSNVLPYENGSALVLERIESSAIILMKEIVIVPLTADGKMGTVTYIPKYTSISGSDSPVTPASLVTDNHIVVIYSDSKVNFKERSMDKMERESKEEKMDAIIATVDKDGSYHKEKLRLPGKETGLFVFGEFSERVDSNHYRLAMGKIDTGTFISNLYIGIGNF